MRLIGAGFAGVAMACVNAGHSLWATLFLVLALGFYKDARPRAKH